MSYEHIVALIDRDLDRLRRARAVLLAPSSPTRAQSEARPKHMLVIASLEASAVEPHISAPAALELPEAPVSIVRVKARVPRQARQISKPASIRIPSALESSAPTVPVFVPSLRVRQEQAEREQLSLARVGMANPAVPEQLTAELLASRWLGGNAF